MIAGFAKANKAFCIALIAIGMPTIAAVATPTGTGTLPTILSKDIIAESADVVAPCKDINALDNSFIFPAKFPLIFK